MQVPLLIPILVLALGALLLPVLSLLPQLRSRCLIGVGVAGLALLGLVLLGSRLPLELVASSWHPLNLLGAPLAFSVDSGSWVLSAVLVGTSMLSLLVCGANGDRPTTLFYALVLAVTATGLVALFASSLVTLIIGWGATDLLLVAAMLSFGQKGIHRAGLALSSGIVASSALWAAQLVAQSGGSSEFLNLAQFSGSSATLFQIAVILRLGLVPLHLWRPIDLDASLAETIPLVVIPTLLGFHLLTFLPALTTGLPSVLFALAALTALVGGFMAWSESDERSSLAGVWVAETGLAVLAVANAGRQAVAVAIAAAVAWALGVTLFSLTPGWSGRRFWRGLPSFLALLSLLGIPPTLGFVVRFTVYSGLEADLTALATALLGETLLVAALIRLWFWAEPRALPSQRPFELLYLAIFGVAALLLMVAGLSPESFVGRTQNSALLELRALMAEGGVTGWAGWALPIVAGMTLFLAGEGLRQRTEGGWRGLGALLRLEWLYGILFVFIRWIGALMRGMANLAEGEGALLWTAVILLIILLYVSGNGGPPGR
jgi:multicomponent Na+:H+ antiporter subunit A